ncbi:MAG TPA: hypothetical protein VGG39_19585 [Polyangiaceae bacterium]
MSRALLRRLLPLAALLPLAVACESAETAPPAAPPPPPPVAAAPPAPAPPPPRTLSRADFNRFAVRLDLPLFWATDGDGDGVPDPDEVKTLLFYPTSGSVDVARGIAAILAYDPGVSAPGLSSEEATRRHLVGEDLDQGAVTMLHSDLRSGSAADKKLLEHMLVAARAIDDIYATMRGSAALASRVPADDASSQSLFRRDWGPACAGAKTRKDPACSAIPGAPKPLDDAYPASLEADPGFCAALQKRPDAKAVVADHFGVVREKDGKLVSVPYSQAYAGPMKAIAAELRAAAADETEPGEAALRAYLEAAARSFTTDDWGPADEAWSRMNAQNSKWYLRVAPDEVLTDPCNLKAQFHLNLARIDPGSVRWQSKLTPLEDEMERALAALVGPPYRARKVTFHLPDFIQVVLNAGDDRQPTGATAGESLPNWGKVEQEGRGRTVAMTNIGTDPDSKAFARKRIESLLDVESAKAWTPDDEPALVGTILHEATHNLGPTYTYAFRGKRGDAVFGGGLASMLEELKAETGAMYWLDWLAKKSVVAPELQRQAYAAWLSWALRHISTGVHSGSEDQPYSQLSAIQVGFLLDEGALAFDPAAAAANGADRGAFAVHWEKFPAAFEKLMKVVATLKAKNDKDAADRLVARYVDGTVVPLALVAERELRFPQTTVAYAVDR